jgi:Uma2 family endonuclease
MAILTPKPGQAKRPRRPAPRPNFVAEESLLSVREWDALPDLKPRYELVEGHLVQKMTTTNSHAWAAGRLLMQLMNWGEDKRWRFLPEGTGVWLDERNGAVPDVVGFGPHQELSPEATHNEAPFLVAEVLSPGTAKRDRTRKKERYAAIEIALYLIIDPSNRTLEVFRASGDSLRYGEPEVLSGDDVWTPEELPGLSLPVARLWL